MEAVVHFALGNYTACNQHIVGGSLNWYENGDTNGNSSSVIHTCILEDVTCGNCLTSEIYKTEVNNA